MGRESKQSNNKPGKKYTISDLSKDMIKISELIPDKKNANKHSEYGTQQLEKGLRQNGLGRSILISADNEIIAGNGVTETAGAIGIEKVRVVETDGTEIIAVKRTDIKSGTKEFYQMALSDNIIAKDNIVMDAEVVDAICEEYEIEEWKMDAEEIADGNEPSGYDQELQWFLNIRCESEQQTHELYEQFIKQGLDVKIVT